VRSSCGEPPDEPQRCGGAFTRKPPELERSSSPSPVDTAPEPISAVKAHSRFGSSCRARSNAQCISSECLAAGNTCPLRYSSAIRAPASGRVTWIEKARSIQTEEVILLAHGRKHCWAARYRSYAPGLGCGGKSSPLGKAKRRATSLFQNGGTSSRSSERRSKPHPARRDHPLLCGYVTFSRVTVKMFAAWLRTCPVTH